MWQGGSVIKQVTSEGGQAWSLGSAERRWEHSSELWPEGHLSTSFMRPWGKLLLGADLLALLVCPAQGQSSICPQRQQKQASHVGLLGHLLGVPLGREAHQPMLCHPEIERET